MKLSEMPAFGLLKGLKVVAMVNNTAGPFCASLFSENGSQVIWIENASVPDTNRAPALKYYFGIEHRNNYAMTLNLATPEGIEILTALLKEADIFMETFKPNTFVKMGLSDERMWEINPKLVIAHISGYGNAGDPEFTKRGAIDGVAQAFGGYIAINGMPDPDPPLMVKNVPADYMTGMMAAWSCMAALYNAQKTGQGESIDLSLVDTILRSEGMIACIAANTGKQPPRLGNPSGSSPGKQVYKCKDGKWVYWNVGWGALMQRTLKICGIEDNPVIPKGVFKFDRYSNPAVTELLEKSMQDVCDTHTAEEMDIILNDSGAIGGKVMEYPDMLAHSHFIAREVFMEWDDPHAGQKIKGMSPIPKFKNNPARIWRGGPTVGMDNDDILEEMGYSKEQIAAMYEKKVLSKGFKGL